MRCWPSSWQALTLYCLLALAAGLLFLLIVVVVWTVSCCTAKAAGSYSRKSVQRLTVGLFSMNVVCL